MKRQVIYLLISCLGLGPLLFWGSYRLGRGEGEANFAESEKSLPGIRAKQSKQSGSRLRNAATKFFLPEGDTSLDALKKRFATTANKSLLFSDPETLTLLATLKPEDCAEAARVAAALPNANRMSMLKAILARWALFEPEKAADFAVNELSPHDIRNSLAAVFQSWGKKNPHEALAFYEKLKAAGRCDPKLGTDVVLIDLFFSWGQEDTTAAANAAQAHVDKGGSVYSWYGIASLAKTEAYREQAVNAALAVSEEKSRLKALRWVIGNWAERDPKSAASWLDENSYTDQETQSAVAYRFAEADPEGNADWLLQRSTPENRDHAFAMALGTWARSDVEAAASWLERVGPTDGSIEILARAYTATDLPKAIEWAQRASEGRRDAAIAGALAHARQFNLNLDMTPYLETGTLSAEDMAKKVEEIGRSRMRF